MVTWFPRSPIKTKVVLIGSWGLFGLCIFLKIFSGNWSSRAVEIELEKTKDYYINDHGDALQKANPYDLTITH